MLWKFKQNSERTEDKTKVNRGRGTARTNMIAMYALHVRIMSIGAK